MTVLLNTLYVTTPEAYLRLEVGFNARRLFDARRSGLQPATDSARCAGIGFKAQPPVGARRSPRPMVPLRAGRGLNPAPTAPVFA
jgi:hypothetical protein